MASMENTARRCGTCYGTIEEDGVEPKQPFSGKLNVRLGSELHAAVAQAAASREISINSWIVEAVRERATAPYQTPDE